MVLTLTADAKAHWKEFYNRHGAQQAELSGDLAAAWSKLEEYAARLALVVHLVRCAAGDLPDGEENVVDAESMAAGVALVEWFKHETRRVYGLLGESDGEKHLRQFAEWIARKGGRVTARQVQQGRRDCPTAADAEAALDALVQANRGTWSIEKTATNHKRVFVLAAPSTYTDSPETP